MDKPAAAIPDPPWPQPETIIAWDGARWVTWEQWQKQQLDRIFGRKISDREKRR